MQSLEIKKYVNIERKKYIKKQRNCERKNWVQEEGSGEFSGLFIIQVS
jgi:hypothetical protein